MNNSSMPVVNTDRVLWRKNPDDAYSPRILVTLDGMIGIDVGGLVVVLNVEQWHQAAREFFGFHLRRTPLPYVQDFYFSFLDETERAHLSPLQLLERFLAYLNSLQNIPLDRWGSRLIRAEDAVLALLLRPELADDPELQAFARSQGDGGGAGNMSDELWKKLKPA